MTIVGLNFKPTTEFSIKVGEDICKEITFHCDSVVIATFYSAQLKVVSFFQCALANFGQSGTNLVTATNDGKKFGTGFEVTVFHEGEEEEHAEVVQELRSEVDYLRTRIMEIQQSILEVNQLEFTLRGRIDRLSPDGTLILFQLQKQQRQQQATTGNNRQQQQLLFLFL